MPDSSFHIWFNTFCTVTAAHVKNIVNIMEFTIAHAEWPVIVSDLLDESGRAELDLLPSTTPFEILFEKTLQLWIASRGPAATFNTLLKILDERDQAETAGMTHNLF